MTQYDDQFIDNGLSEMLARVGLPPAVNLQEKAPWLLPIVQEIEDPPLAETITYIKAPPRLRFACVCDTSFNAVAFRMGDIYVIGINMGVVNKCLAFADCLFANRSFLPTLGNAGMEHEFIGMPKLEGRDFVRKSDHVIPTCPVRSQSAHLFGSLMLSFVLLHEQMHVLRGHVDFALEAGFVGVSEVHTSSTQLAGPSVEFRIAQEFDADCSAAMKLYRLIRERRDMYDQSPLFTDLNMRILIATLAPYSVLGLLEPWKPTPRESALTAGYPPLEVRRAMALNAALLAEHAVQERVDWATPSITATRLAIADASKAVFRIARNVPHTESIEPIIQASEKMGPAVEADLLACMRLWPSYAEGYARHAYVDIRGS